MHKAVTNLQKNPVKNKIVVCAQGNPGIIVRHDTSRLIGEEYVGGPKECL